MHTLRILLAAGLLSAAAAQAHIVTFTGVLGPEMSGATGTGFVQVDYQEEFHLLTIDATFSGLSGDTTIAHIHCCVATPGAGSVGVAVTPGTLPGFPAGVKAGTYLQNIDLSLSGSFTNPFLAANGGTPASAEAALVAALNSGRAYFNIHTTTFGGGEIRAFLYPVPEPGTVALMLAGLGAVAFAARRRRR